MLAAYAPLRKYGHPLNKQYESLEGLDQLWNMLQGPVLNLYALKDAEPEYLPSVTSAERWGFSGGILAFAASMVMYDWFHGRSVETSNPWFGSTLDRRSAVKLLAGLIGGGCICIRITKGDDRATTYYADAMRKEISKEIALYERRAPYTHNLFLNWIRALHAYEASLKSVYEDARWGTKLYRMSSGKAYQPLRAYRRIMEQTFLTDLSLEWRHYLTSAFATEEMRKFVKQWNEFARKGCHLEHEWETNGLYLLGEATAFILGGLEVMEWCHKRGYIKTEEINSD